MKFDLNDIAYGLRNLLIGDAEETRIEDYENLPSTIQRMIDRKQYEMAYRLMIRAAVGHLGLTRDQVRDGVAAWLVIWAGDEPGKVTVEALMNVFDNEVMK